MYISHNFIVLYLYNYNMSVSRKCKVSDESRVFQEK